jgi:hypothetical protein
LPEPDSENSSATELKCLSCVSSAAVNASLRALQLQLRRDLEASEQLLVRARLEGEFMPIRERRQQPHREPRDELQLGLRSGRTATAPIEAGTSRGDWARERAAGAPREKFTASLSNEVELARQDRELYPSNQEPRPPMKYVMVIYETQENLEAREQGVSNPYIAAWRTYYKALVAAGVFAGGGAPLKDSATATTVRTRNGRRLVQDGPFAEAKEQLGGFMVLEAPSLDAVLEWAARCPAAATGTVEVRPMDVANHEQIIAD